MTWEQAGGGAGSLRTAVVEPAPPRKPGYSIALLDADIARDAFDAALRSHDVEDATRAAAELWAAMKRLREAT